MKENEINPVELCVEVSDVDKRYPITEAMEIVRCKDCIFFHSTGFFAVSKPTLANNLKGGALFETLRWYCDYQDSRDDYSAEEQERLDTVAAMVVNVLTLPLDVFTDTDLMLDISDYILRRRQEYYDRLSREASEPHAGTLDDAVENANFEGEVLAQESIIGGLKKKSAGEEAVGDGRTES